MRAVIQRVSKSSVHIDGQLQASIDQGLLVLLGIETADTEADLCWLSQKIVQVRIFGDAQGQMNRSVKEIEGGILLVSQFTLHAATKKGNRPSFISAARPEQAIPLYEEMIRQLRKDLGRPVQSGVFGADMQVSLINDGPVTIIIDTKNKI
ncbi:D-aminoacyl-tRNA deacylase [Niabella terrae]